MYVLPPLPYSYDALEPYIDTKTMELHHDKHHQTYIDKVNKAIENLPAFNNIPIEQLLKVIPSLPEGIQNTVRDNGGGHYNHSFFWKLMKPNGGGQPRGILAEHIGKTFGSFEKFQADFNQAAQSRFGSGWAWLCARKNGTLYISSTANQDCPLWDDLIPVLGLDVWEHAYYLLYNNRRPDYITAWWHVINWDQAEENYRAALQTL